MRRAALMVVAMVLLAVSCSSAESEASSPGPTPVSAATETAEATAVPGPTPVSAATETAEATATTDGDAVQTVRAAASALPPPPSLNDPYISYWAPRETTGDPSMYYAMGSSTVQSDLYDFDTNEFRVAIPFGAPPTDGGTLRVWSQEGGPAHGGAPASIYPVECLGPTPDIDGDGLLDQCDPFPTDGPQADFDSDGVRNHDDNCPVVPNPDQLHNGRTTEGEACWRDDDSEPNRILISDLTIDDVNAERAADGLPALVWPVVDPVLRPEVAEYCEFTDNLFGGGGPGGDDVFRTLVAELPDAYGLSEPDKAQLLDYLLRLNTLAQGIEEDADYARVEAEIDEIMVDMAPFVAPMEFSDQSCDPRG